MKPLHQVTNPTKYSSRAHFLLNIISYYHYYFRYINFTKISKLYILRKYRSIDFNLDPWNKKSDMIFLTY